MFYLPILRNSIKLIKWWRRFCSAKKINLMYKRLKLHFNMYKIVFLISKHINFCFLSSDNVHFQNSAQLSAALIKKKIPFKTQVCFTKPIRIIIFYNKSKRHLLDEHVYLHETIILICGSIWVWLSWSEKNGIYLQTRGHSVWNACLRRSKWRAWQNCSTQ